MTEREDEAAAEERRERRGALRCALVGALVVVAPLGFVEGLPPGILAVVGAGLLVVYAGLVWFYNLHAVGELVLIVLFVSVALTVALRGAVRELRQRVERGEAAASVEGHASSASAAAGLAGTSAE